MQSKTPQRPGIGTRKNARPPSLAPLRKYQPDGILPREGADEFHHFVLALALVFNDLKGLTVWRDQILASKPTNQTEVSPEAGEWSGYEIQNYRLLAGQLHELFRLLFEFRDVLDDERLRRIMRKAHPSVRKQWSDLVLVAEGKEKPHDSPVAKVLTQIRSNAAYHYHQPKKLVQGYREFFFNTPTSPENEAAYASIGVNMRGTRFYFADAAMKSALALIAESEMPNRRFLKRVGIIADSVSECLAHVIGEYIKSARLP